MKNATVQGGWGIIPAAGLGSRIQPLAFSKELLPVGSRRDGASERPKAVSEYLVDRMIRGGASKICIVISAGKSDIVEYFGSVVGQARICYVVQQQPSGLCDAVFQALPFIDPRESVFVGLPDTVWFPEHGFNLLPDGGLSFLLFPVDAPEHFDAVSSDGSGNVLEIEVKSKAARSQWIWGAFKVTGAVLADLYGLWCERSKSDVYFGTLVNEYLARGGRARAVRAGEAYVDVGTIDGYRRAVRLLESPKG